MKTLVRRKIFNLGLLGVGLLLTFVCRVEATTYYVNVSNLTPIAPFTNWPTAATEIQSAIDTATNGDLILVTNGIYNTGGRVVFGALTNRVAINKAITVQSVNGPSVTIIQGNSNLTSSAIRCVYMTNSSTLSGFTLTNGGTLASGDSLQEMSGGGLWANSSANAMVTNCVLIRNIANAYGGGIYQGYVVKSVIIQNSSSTGGGVASSTLTNCLVSSNSASGYGGGAYSGTLNNCKVLQNIANFGGGVYFSSLYGCLMVSNVARNLGGAVYSGQTIQNCTIVANSSLDGAGGVATADGSVQRFRNNIVLNNIVYIGSTSNYSAISSVINCCIFPLPPNGQGSGNITNDPSFVDYAGGDYRLKSNSPCINSGISQTLIVADLDEKPRLVDGFVDIGAYENQDSHFVLPYTFALQYGLSTDGSLDTDGDGMSNWAEAYAGTNPTNSTSFLKIQSVTNNASGATVTWQGVFGKKYFLQRSTNLLAQPAFTIIQSNISMLSPFPSTLAQKDTTATNATSNFYRIGVQ